jgi:hypothetical protein
MCVILPLAHHFLPLQPDLRHCRPAGGNQRRRTQRLRAWRNHMGKETTPLWVWLSVALLAIGTGAYVTTVYFIEYIIGFF